MSHSSHVNLNVDSNIVELHLSNSVVVVIGGSSGIGLACVEQFLDEGASVAIWDLHPPADERASAAHYLVADVTSQSSLQQSLSATESRFGPIQHVVNSAAVGSGKFGSPFTRLDPEDWRRVLDVNVLGMTNVAHVTVPGLVRCGAGTFTMIASVAGQVGSPTDPPYSASKAANINFAQVMARDLASSGVRVNSVCPGMVRTPLNRAVWQSWNERQSNEERLTYEDWAQQKIEQLVPLNRWQRPEDVANAVVFLASDKARQITGQTINVDGGYVMHS